MTFKRKLFVTYLDFFMYIFKQKKFKNTLHIHCDTNKRPDESIDLITIAFNNAYLIEQQIKLVRKYITDTNVTHIIADNSTDGQCRERLYALCQKEGVAYISLPRNPVTYYVRRACYSHGSAMNWMYHNIIKPRQPRYFGFIDHDIFPTRPYSIAAHLKGLDFYGEKRDLKAGWYLWAGFCFFDYRATAGYRLNFFPYMQGKTYLDTGGANFPVLYSNYQMSGKYFCPPPQNLKIGAGNEYYIDYIQYIDRIWVHSICAERYDQSPAKKEFMDKLFGENGE